MTEPPSPREWTRIAVARRPPSMPRPPRCLMPPFPPKGRIDGQKPANRDTYIYMWRLASLGRRLALQPSNRLFAAAEVSRRESTGVFARGRLADPRHLRRHMEGEAHHPGGVVARDDVGVPPTSIHELRIHLEIGAIDQDAGPVQSRDLIGKGGQPLLELFFGHRRGAVEPAQLDHVARWAIDDFTPVVLVNGLRVSHRFSSLFPVSWPPPGLRERRPGGFPVRRAP